MSHHLGTRSGGTPDMAEIYSDAATIGHALAFEAALARAQGDEGLIVRTAADAIVAAAGGLHIDPEELADEAEHAGTLAIPLVRRLRVALPEDVAAKAHLGATSQDVADTVLTLQMKAGARLLDRDAARLCVALCAHAERHAGTPAIGRTLLQDACPIGFGLRFAQAAAGIDDARRRLADEIGTAARIQLGGAAGTRAGLGGKGAAIAARVARELDLANSEPWHARRTGLAAVASALAILIGAAAKFARDIALLSQDRIAEAREPRVAGRGGSSAMPHKRNPTGCQVALSAAYRAPGLAASLLGGLPQEAERGLGGWQAEGPVLADLFGLAAASLAAMTIVAEGLEIDADAIARNLAEAGQGSDIGESEALVAALVAHIGRS
ncbi:MAG: 3-carboxy-cis,cis-muconate cycloisomerase [Sphingopyxis sp.]|nr:3-carboxy-cis,cis-muconate cycloisomerase [Sphingopyxis sp.]